jgi:hypothetical protein
MDLLSSHMLRPYPSASLMFAEVDLWGNIVASDLEERWRCVVSCLYPCSSRRPIADTDSELLTRLSLVC